MLSKDTSWLPQFKPAFCQACPPDAWAARPGALLRLRLSDSTGVRRQHLHEILLRWPFLPDQQVQLPRHPPAHPRHPPARSRDLRARPARSISLPSSARRGRGNHPKHSLSARAIVPPTNLQHQQNLPPNQKPLPPRNAHVSLPWRNRVPVPPGTRAR